MSSRMDRYFAGVQSELAEERAAALTRAGKKVERAMLRCDELLALVTEAEGDEEERSAGLTEYAEARKTFEEALWAYCVQREALGLNDHRWVHRIYVAPPRVDELLAG